MAKNRKTVRFFPRDPTRFVKNINTYGKNYEANLDNMEIVTNMIEKMQKACEEQAAHLHAWKEYEELKKIAKRQKRERKKAAKAQKAEQEKRKDKMDILLEKAGESFRVKDLRNIYCEKRTNINREEALRFWRTLHKETVDKCLFCKGTLALQVCHIWGKEDGGEEELQCDYKRNIFILCATCHYLFDEGMIFINEENNLILEKIIPKDIAADYDEEFIEANQLLNDNFDYEYHVLSPVKLDCLTADHIMCNRFKIESLIEKKKLTEKDYLREEVEGDD